jgi:hypothetical protein
MCFALRSSFVILLSDVNVSCCGWALGIGGRSDHFDPTRPLVPRSWLRESFLWNFGGQAHHNGMTEKQTK